MICLRASAATSTAEERQAENARLIEVLVAAAPPLSSSQRVKLGRLLAGGGR